MRALLLLSLLALVSCGGESPEESSASGLGTTREYNPLVISDPDAQSKILAVCDALRFKQTMELTSMRFNLEYSKKECEQNELTLIGTSNHGIRNESGSYSFRDFPLPSVETESDGVMRGICEDLRRDSQMTTPMIDEAGAVVNFSTMVGTTECDTGADRVCMMVERGTLSPDHKTWTASTKHIITFKTSGPYRGFYLQRYMADMNFCKSAGKVREQRVVLKI